MFKKLAVVLAVSGVTLVGTAAPLAAADGPTAPLVQANLDNAFVLLAAVLVIFMQAGFALVEAGLTRAKSVANIMMKNLTDFFMGILAFFAVGFALAYGTGNDFIGTSGFFLENLGSFNSYVEPAGSLTLPVFFVFQVAFAATAATIVSGAMAERTKFIAYVIYSVCISAVIYPVVVHWFWGGGWLATMDTPFIDFAGSTIVHSVGGWAALVGVLFLGPRLGKYGPDGKPRTISGHSIPFAILGTFILWVGWYGFNPGSELAADGAIGAIALTTTLSGAAGAAMAMITTWIRSGKPDVGMTANGALAGLVGITAGCAAVENWAAVAIGAIAGVLVVFSITFFEKVRIDDPVGAISVHGVCGAFGTLAVGLFAAEGGLLTDGSTDQLVAQVIGVVSVFAFVAVAAAIMFGLIRATVGLRVSEEEEFAGLDLHEHGAPGYADFVFADVESLELETSSH